MNILRRRSASRKSLLHFTRQLRVFIKGGVPLAEAIRIISEETDDVPLRGALTSVLDALNTGDSLSSGFEKHPLVFPAYFVGLVRSAEATGHFLDALDSLATYQSRIIESRTRITSALAYPGIVMALAIGTVAILAGFVIPRFEPLFEELGSTLPLPTRVLLGTTSAVANNALIVCASIAASILLLVASLRSRRGRRLVDVMLLSAPILGTIVRYVLLERFCRIFSATIRSGLPVTEGMRLSTQTIANAAVAEKLTQATRDMVMGIGFAAALARTGLFPGATRQMFRVGEETGSLDEQVAAAGEYLDSELQLRMSRLTALFEPSLIVFVGLVVGFVAVALVSAMYGVLDGVRDIP